MLNGSSLEHVTSFKDLGVLVSSDLSWKGHIDNVVSKCNRGNGMVKRVVGYHAPNNVAFNLYKSLTRSIVEYSAPVWYPQNANELTKLESVQRAMTRFVTKFDGRSYQDRCIELNLLPLCFRHEISDLFFSISVYMIKFKFQLKIIPTLLTIHRVDLVTAACF